MATIAAHPLGTLRCLVAGIYSLYAVGVTDFNAKVRSHNLLLNAFGFNVADAE